MAIGGHRLAVSGLTVPSRLSISRQRLSVRINPKREFRHFCEGTKRWQI